MVGGFAHISGGLMAVFTYGSVAAKSSVMSGLPASCAAPASLYLSKLFLPRRPKSRPPAARSNLALEKTHANVIDAAAAGASDADALGH